MSETFIKSQVILDRKFQARKRNCDKVSLKISR
jgi:hypothetical protein